MPLAVHLQMYGWLQICKCFFGLNGKYKLFDATPNTAGFEGTSK